MTGIGFAVLEGGRQWALSHGVNLADYRLIIYALMLIAMMIFRPEGLFGLHEVWDYLRIGPLGPSRSQPQPAEASA
jgi:ABC-type branched-subunit amino acid transport system permease subunit